MIQWPYTKFKADPSFLPCLNAHTFLVVDALKYYLLYRVSLISPLSYAVLYNQEIAVYNFNYGGLHTKQNWDVLLEMLLLYSNI